MRVFWALIFAFLLSACSGSQTDNSEVKQEVTTANPVVVVEDIFCDVSYPLVIDNVYQPLPSSDKMTVAALYDGDKTNQSSWQAQQLESQLVIELNRPALLKALVLSWKDLAVSHNYAVLVSKDGEQWQELVGPSVTAQGMLIPDVVNLADDGNTAKYLQLLLTGSVNGQSETLASELVEIEVFGCSGNGAGDSGHDIELVDWYLSIPTDSDYNGRSDRIAELELANGFFDPRFFSLSKDGGLIFSTSVSGYRTSTNTKYVRSELREMLRRGDTSYSTQGISKNNWVFASAPALDRENAGGVDGLLEVDLAVNKVTTTGEAYQVGRVIIGQIHANDDEPIRVYYRKLPNNDKGSIYIAHEQQGGDDSYYEVIGSRGNSATNPPDGIPLDERFSYSIKVIGNDLTFVLTKADGSEYSQIIDMSQSGYDEGGQYQYFKVGVYNQNNSGDVHDYVRATFYQIDNSHTGYSGSARNIHSMSNINK